MDNLNCFGMDFIIIPSLLVVLNIRKGLIAELYHRHLQDTLSRYRLGIEWRIAEPLYKAKEGGHTKIDLFMYKFSLHTYLELHFFLAMEIRTYPLGLVIF